MKKDPSVVSARLEEWLPYGTPLEIGAMLDPCRVLPAAILQAIADGDIGYDKNTYMITYPAASVLELAPENMGWKALTVWFLDMCRTQSPDEDRSRTDPEAETRSVTTDDIVHVMRFNADYVLSAFDLMRNALGKPGPKRRPHVHSEEEALHYRITVYREAQYFRRAFSGMRSAAPDPEEVLASGCDGLLLLEYMLMPGNFPPDGRFRSDFQKLTWYAGQVVTNWCDAQNAMLAYTDDGVPVYERRPRQSQ